jgi:ABC-2 type transport system ATP-binding protein
MLDLPERSGTLMLAVRTENLTKIYKKRYFLKPRYSVGISRLNLEVEEGETFGLLGLNGSGKTTTIKLLLGLLFADSGQAFIYQHKVPNREASNLVGYLPEAPYFYRYLSAQEIIDFYGRLSGVPEEVRQKKIDEILELVNLTQNRHKRLAEFSKGMLQRVGIAQALIHDPKILFFDELITGLDPVGITEMRSLLLRLKERKKTIFLSSHIISEIVKVCDRVGIVKEGELVKIVDLKHLKDKDVELEKIFLSTVMPAGQEISS